MPKKDFMEEDENIQQWTPIVIKKEPILTNDNVEITYDQFISMMINKRKELKLGVLQLNTMCSFVYKYTIRDIESRKTNATALEIKKICSILNLDLKK